MCVCVCVEKNERRKSDRQRQTDERQKRRETRAHLGRVEKTMHQQLLRLELFDEVFSGRVDDVLKQKQSIQ